MSPRNWKLVVVTASVIALVASVIIIIVVTRQGEGMIIKKQNCFSLPIILNFDPNLISFLID